MKQNRTVQLFITGLFILVGMLTQAQQNIFRFTDQGFKIAQFTDTHIKANRKSSVLSIQTIEKVLDLEKPDLVIYTGDIVTGRPVFKGWDLILAPCIKRQIPYAVVFGNHDDENGKSRKTLADKISKMPFSQLVPKVDNVYGFGNYLIEVSSQTENQPALLIYCMDSNAYSTNKKYKGYGWFMTSQIEWFKQQGSTYKKQLNKTLPALAFFHIPLPEYTEAFTSDKFLSIGNRQEKECSPVFNSGMFEAMVESGDVMGTFVGHDHVNDYVACRKGIALAYGRFTGSSTTYGDLDCGARVILLHEGERAFTSWIRTGNGEKIQEAKFPDDLIIDNEEILTYE